MKPDSRSSFPRSSTRALIQEARRTPGYSFSDWLHGYIYGRWIYQYISIGIGEHRLARLLGPPVRWLGKFLPHRAAEKPDAITFADTYHCKVVRLEEAAQLVTVQEDVCLKDLDQAIPYALARDIVLKNPDHIIAIDCACRAARSNPCLPLDVCLVIGEPFASFVAEHHPQRSRWITPDEAVEILRAEDERGHVHHAAFKDAMLGRFYAICNCCSCCCGAIQSWERGSGMLASSGYVAAIAGSACIGCGSCVDSCQFGAISLLAGQAVVDRERCMGCGVCIGQCPSEAIMLERDLGRSEPLAILDLIARAAETAQPSTAEEMGIVAAGNGPQ